MLNKGYVVNSAVDLGYFLAKVFEKIISYEIIARENEFIGR